MTWIYQTLDWPTFTWNDAVLTQKLADIRYQQGHLLGRMESLGLNLRAKANLNTLTTEVVTTSAIEGATLNPEEVRSSIARRLGLDVGGAVVAGRDIGETLSEVLFKVTIWSLANRQPLNNRQHLILQRMLDGFKGYTNTSKYAKIAKFSTDTALHDIKNLVKSGLLIQNPSGGRSTSYRLRTDEEL